MAISLPKFIFSDEDLVTFEEYKARQLAESSLHEFAKQAWPNIEGDEPYVDGWHIQTICEHLEAVTRREIRNLMIHVPPRSMKSSLVSVIWPAWVWINKPEEQFLYASYAASLSLRDSRKCRRLISSDWYQRCWGDIVKLVSDQNTKGRFENIRNGYRIAASVGSSVTGEGGSVLVVDDGNNSRDGESETKREGTNDWWSQVWSTRLNNSRTGVRVIVQQRINERDLSGYVMSLDSDGNWIKLILPMEFEEKRRSKTIILPSTNGKIWQDPRKKEGELLWPERIGPEQLKELKANLRSEYLIAGQLQQRPAPEDGGIIKKSSFIWWKEESPPKVEFVIQSWDTALEAKESNCYSACTTWGYFKAPNGLDSLILLNMWRGRLEFPELRILAQNLYHDYRNDGTRNIIVNGKHAADFVLVEAKASGAPLIQSLRRAGINAIAFNPKDDKVRRARLASMFVSSGQIYMPSIPPTFVNLRSFAHTFVELCSIFPNGEAADVVDTFSQIMQYLQDSGWLSNRFDPKETPQIKERKGFYADEGE
jgi:predicted phage terminase large subunit-like protein